MMFYFFDEFKNFVTELGVSKVPGQIQADPVMGNLYGKVNPNRLIHPVDPPSISLPKRIQGCTPSPGGIQPEKTGVDPAFPLPWTFPIHHPLPPFPGKRVGPVQDQSTPNPPCTHPYRKQKGRTSCNSVHCRVQTQIIRRFFHIFTCSLSIFPHLI